MKTYNNLVRRWGMACVVLFLIISIYGCPSKSSNPTPDPCTPTNGSETTNVNGFDLNQSSPYYNQVVAVFNFSQTETTYSNNCKVTQFGATSLKITNATTKTISFAYNINFVRNFVSWNYQNIATIAPSTTIDVGSISNSPVETHGGVISISSTAITYK